MRLITLNTWGARIYEPFIQFIRDQAPTTDIFCLQEVFHSTSDRAFTGASQTRTDMVAQIEKVIGEDFAVYFAPAHQGFDEDGRVDFHLEYGNAIFIRRTIPVKNYEAIFIHGEWGIRDTPGNEDSRPRCVQLLELEDKVIINFHGLWKDKTYKKDIPERFEQSRKMRKIMDTLSDPIILCGDFNLVPDGECIKIIEKGMRNLITEYGVTSTRSSHYDPNKPTRLADYILISPEIEVKDFAVMPDEVSDHLPLLLDF